MGGVRTNPEELSTIRKLAGTGLSYAEVGRKLKRSSSFIATKAREMQVTCGDVTTETPTVSVTLAKSAGTEQLTAAELAEILTSDLTAETKRKVILAFV